MGGLLASVGVHRLLHRALEVLHALEVAVPANQVDVAFGVLGEAEPPRVGYTLA